MTTKLNKVKNLREYTMRGDINEHHERIIRNLFNALFVIEFNHCVKTDHSPNDSNIMTLDIYQVQQAMVSHSNQLYTHMEIIDALHDLIEPKLLVKPSTIHFNSELNGKRIQAIRLDYNQAKVTDEKQPLDPSNFPMMPCSSKYCTLQKVIDSTTNVFQRLNVALNKHNKGNQRLKTEAKCDKEAWKKQAFINYEQYELAKMSTSNLRAVIVELAETLHAADGNARISITSSELLELLHSNEDHLDTAF